MLHTGFPSPTKFQYHSRPSRTAPATLDPTAPSDFLLSSVACLIPVLVSPCPALSLSVLVCPCPGLPVPVLVSPYLCPGLSPSVPVCPRLSLSWSLSLFWPLPDSVLGLGVQAIGASGALGEPAGE